MRAVSVGFSVLDARREWVEGEQVTVITEAELYEISCVPVPANPNALSKSAARKLEFVERKKAEREAEKSGDDDRVKEWENVFFDDSILTGGEYLGDENKQLAAGEKTINLPLNTALEMVNYIEDKSVRKKNQNPADKAQVITRGRGGASPNLNRRKNYAGLFNRHQAAKAK